MGHLSSFTEKLIVKLDFKGVSLNVVNVNTQIMKIWTCSNSKALGRFVSPDGGFLKLALKAKKS